MEKVLEKALNSGVTLKFWESTNSGKVLKVRQRCSEAFAKLWKTIRHRAARIQFALREKYLPTITFRAQLLTLEGASKAPSARLLPSAESVHLQLQQVAQAALTLFVDEILAVTEVAAAVLGLIHGLPLRDGHVLPLQGDESVLGWI